MIAVRARRHDMNELILRIDRQQADTNAIKRKRIA